MLEGKPVYSVIGRLVFSINQTSDIWATGCFRNDRWTGKSFFFAICWAFFTQKVIITYLYSDSVWMNTSYRLIKVGGGLFPMNSYMQTGQCFPVINEGSDSEAIWSPRYFSCQSTHLNTVSLWESVENDASARSDNVTPDMSDFGSDVAAARAGW